MNTARQKNKTQKKPKQKNHQASSIGMGGGGMGPPYFFPANIFLKFTYRKLLVVATLFLFTGRGGRGKNWGMLIHSKFEVVVGKVGVSMFSNPQSRGQG